MRPYPNIGLVVMIALTSLVARVATAEMSDVQMGCQSTCGGGSCQGTPSEAGETCTCACDILGNPSCQCKRPQ
jgi:hypothetical protein